MVVGVIGAGTMGAGIAQAFAQVDGYEVCLCDLNEIFAGRGKARIAANLQKRVDKGKMTQERADEILGRIRTGTKYICEDCDLIVEAAIENMQIKKDTFKELSTICKKDCLFTTNTSSLSITEIGAGLDRPVTGMHFFNPAPVMKLVEVSGGLDTPQEILDKISGISEDIGKIPVQMQEYAGFVVNRILIPMINEAIGVFAENDVPAEKIDADRTGCRPGDHAGPAERDRRFQVSSAPASQKDGPRRSSRQKDRHGILQVLIQFS